MESGLEITKETARVVPFPINRNCKDHSGEADGINRVVPQNDSGSGDSSSPSPFRFVEGNPDRKWAEAGGF